MLSIQTETEHIMSGQEMEIKIQETTEDLISNLCFISLWITNNLRIT